MQASTAPNLVAAARPALRISTRSVWSDQVWHLDGHRPGGNRSDFSLDWGFALADDSRFSDLQWTDWREAAKLFLWSLKLDPPPGRRNVHKSTIVSAFKTLRKLIRWMAAQGYRSFADLDRDGCDRFMAAMAQRPGSKPGKTLKSTTLQTYANLLTRLYLQGAKFPEVAIDDPFPGIAPPFTRQDQGWLPYTPDAVAVPLVSAALRLIGTPADDVIALQTQAQSAYDDALARAISQTKAGFIVTDAIAPFIFRRCPVRKLPGMRRLSPALSRCGVLPIAFTTPALSSSPIWSAPGPRRSSAFRPAASNTILSVMEARPSPISPDRSTRRRAALTAKPIAGLLRRRSNDPSRSWSG